MKKILALILAVLLSMSMALAGSIENLDYKDSNMFWTLDRQVDDYNVWVNADRLNGVSKHDIYERMDYKDGKMLEQALASDTAINNVIYQNDEKWSTDSSGWSKHGVMDYLYNGFLEFLYTKFLAAEVEERLNERMDMIEAKAEGYKGSEIVMRAAQFKACRLGINQEVYGYSCGCVACIRQVS